MARVVRYTHTPLSEWSARHRGRYLHDMQRTQHTNIHTLNWIRTRDVNSWKRLQA